MHDRAASDVLQSLSVGLLCLVLSFLPVGSAHRPLLYGATMSVALMFTWIAAGLGLYGIVRYPSRRLLLAATVAVMTAVLSGARFWQLAPET